jgi:hypothetical protein
VRPLLLLLGVVLLLALAATRLPAAPPAAPASAPTAPVEWLCVAAADRGLPDSLAKQRNEHAAERWEFVGWVGMSSNFVVRGPK